MLVFLKSTDTDFKDFMPSCRNKSCQQGTVVFSGWEGG